MSREFNRYIQAQFAARLPALSLRPDKPVGPLAWAGERCFRSAGDGTVCWICIIPSQKGYNEFNIELAWSHRGTYPVSGFSRPHPRAVAPDCFSSMEEGWVRIGNLCDPPRLSWAVSSTSDMLESLTVERAQLLGEPLVEHAMASITSIGMPLMRVAVDARSQFSSGRAA